jgi:hypothetical protein
MAAPGQPPGQRLASISFYTGIITAILSLASCIPALGLCVACVLFFSGVFAAVLGFVAQGDMNRHGGGLEQDRSHARWGIVTGLLGVVIAGVGAILSLVLVAAISSSGPR